MFSATDVAGAFYEISFDLLTQKLRDQMDKWFDLFFWAHKGSFSDICQITRLVFVSQVCVAVFT